MKLFIDTNIPLHHKPLDQIGWKEVTGLDDLTLVFLSSWLMRLTSTRITLDFLPAQSK
jgi:hypothetical protein